MGGEPTTSNRDRRGGVLRRRWAAAAFRGAHHPELIRRMFEHHRHPEWFVPNQIEPAWLKPLVDFQQYNIPLAYNVGMKIALNCIQVMILLIGGCAANPTIGPLPTAGATEPAATATIALPPMKTITPVVKPTAQPTTMPTHPRRSTPARCGVCILNFWYPAQR